MWPLAVMTLLVPAPLLAAASPHDRATGEITLKLRSCDGESPEELRSFDIRNQRFEVIDRYGQPLRVVKMTEAWSVDGCSEGPTSATVRFDVTPFPRDGSAAGKSIRIDAEGQDPEILGGFDWDLLRVTRHGCCGAEDGHTFFRPDDGLKVAMASGDPVPLQLINRVPDSGGEQGSLWRWAFALGSTSALFDHADDRNQGVIAEVILAGPDRDSARYAIRFESPPYGDDGEAPGPWSVRALRWTGSGLDEGGQTWWIDGGPPTAKQFSGMALELTLECQCDAAPLSLRVPVEGDALARAEGRGLKLEAR